MEIRLLVAVPVIAVPALPGWFALLLVLGLLGAAGLRAKGALIARHRLSQAA